MPTKPKPTKPIYIESDYDKPKPSFFLREGILKYPTYIIYKFNLDDFCSLRDILESLEDVLDESDIIEDSIRHTIAAQPGFYINLEVIYDIKLKWTKDSRQYMKLADMCSGKMYELKKNKKLYIKEASIFYNIMDSDAIRVVR